MTTPNPSNPGTPNPGNPSNLTEEEVKKLKTQVEEIQGKLETVTRQYNGSTSEALRLKDELTQVREELENAKRQVETRSPASDEAVQKVFGEDGAGVITDLLQKVVKPLQDKVDSLLTKGAEEEFKRFKNSHPGLKGEILTLFQQKLEALKPAYSDVGSAMTDAYRLIGGEEADRKALETVSPEEAKRLAEEERKRAAGIVGTPNAGDSRIPGDGSSTELTILEKKLEAMQSKAAVNSLAGTTDFKLLAEIEGLTEKIASLKQ